jgi:hypothetical protein
MNGEEIGEQGIKGLSEKLLRMNELYIIKGFGQRTQPHRTLERKPRGWEETKPVGAYFSISIISDMKLHRYLPYCIF